MADSTVIKSLNGLEIYDKAMREGVVATSEDSINYVAAVNGISALVYGMSFVIVPNVNAYSESGNDAFTLNVNGIGATQIKRRLSGSASAATPDSVEEWIKKDNPIRVTYSKSGVVDAWVIDAVYPDLGSGVYGTLGVSSGGTGAKNSVDALHNLGIHWGSQLAEEYWGNVDNGDELKKNTIYIQIVNNE